MGFDLPEMSRRVTNPLRQKERLMLTKGRLVEMKWGMAANVYRVSFGDNENAKLW